MDSSEKIQEALRLVEQGLSVTKASAKVGAKSDSVFKARKRMLERSAEGSQKGSVPQPRGKVAKGNKASQNRTSDLERVIQEEMDRLTKRLTVLKRILKELES